jgi:tetratricopeptide (TPR) repeat protein
VRSTKTELWDPAVAAPSKPKVAGVPEPVSVADTDTVMLEDGEAPPVQTAPDVVTRQVAMRPGELLPGSKYRLVRWLGDGGMGTVFEAVHEDLDRRVALKVLRSTFGGPVLDLFRQEARTLGRLGSRFVVDVYDFLELPDGRLVIAMELLQGQTLRQVLKERGTLPCDRVVPIARQICKGLAVAHDAGIVHRDIKPENISLEVVEGRADAVKLLDFGIAQVGGKRGGAESRAGTPGYLAPELISGIGGDERSDIYAVGCALFELVTGRRPFEHEDPSEVLLAHLGEDPVPPSALADVSRPLEQLILTCLEKSPRDRYQDAAALEVALCEVQIHEGFTTEWDDLPFPDVAEDIVERLRRRMPAPRRIRKRRWLPWVLVAVAGVAAAAAWAGYTVRSAEQAPVDGGTLALANEARAAAARAFYVYPPPEDPTFRTAYGCVLELETQQGATGLELAAELRSEFADTLERLGDEYWDAEGGKPFALDYYAEALVFEPQRPRALERAAMTPGEFRLLRSKAQQGSFSAQELAAVEPLIVLSDVSADDKQQRIASMEQRSPHSAERRRVVKRLAQARTRPAALPTPEPVPETTEPDVGSVPDVGLDVGGGQVVEEAVDGTVEPYRDKARALTVQGDKAHANGKSAQAERLYAEALAADRRHGAAYRGLGRVAFDRGSYALAARQLKKAVRLAPGRAEYRVALGDALFKSFDYAGAKAQYLRAKELGAKQAEARLAKVARKLP